MLNVQKSNCSLFTLITAVIMNLWPTVSQCILCILNDVSIQLSDERQPTGCSCCCTSNNNIAGRHLNTLGFLIWWRNTFKLISCPMNPKLLSFNYHNTPAAALMTPIWNNLIILHTEHCRGVNMKNVRHFTCLFSLVTGISSPSSFKSCKTGLPKRSVCDIWKVSIMSVSTLPVYSSSSFRLWNRACRRDRRDICWSGQTLQVNKVKQFN